MLSREELFGGKRVAVIGAARTGTAVARALVPLGAKVVVYDGKPISESIEAKITGAGAGSFPAMTRTRYWKGRHPDSESRSLEDTPRLIAASDAASPCGVKSRLRSVVRAPIIAVTGTNGKTTTTH